MALHKQLFTKISQNSWKRQCRSLFLTNCRLEACNFIRKETQAQVIFCEFCYIFKNAFLQNTPATVSDSKTWGTISLKLNAKKNSETLPKIVFFLAIFQKFSKMSLRGFSYRTMFWKHILSYDPKQRILYLRELFFKLTLPNLWPFIQQVYKWLILCINFFTFLLLLFVFFVFTNSFSTKNYFRFLRFYVRHLIAVTLRLKKI